MRVRTILMVSRPFGVVVFSAIGTLSLLSVACGSDTPEATAIGVSVPVATSTSIVASVHETPTVRSRQLIFTDESPTLSLEALLSV